jgi:endogenous inhibitor of DNA gyrase (YacG/DUF329 family)
MNETKNKLPGFVKLKMKIVCPICKNTTTWEENPWRPFCSERCKLIDLGKWVSEEYKIPVKTEEETEEVKEEQKEKEGK